MVVAQLRGRTFGCKQLSVVDSVPEPAPDVTPAAAPTPTTATASANFSNLPLRLAQTVNQHAVVAIQSAPALKHRRRAKNLLASPVAKHFAAAVLSKDDIYALTR